jgi:hypothetical protein
MTEKQEALPCPFCGTPKPSVYQAGGYWKIKCVDGCSITINGSSSRASVVGAWNRRPADGAGELAAAAEHLLQFRQGILAKEYDKLSPTLAGALHDLAMAVKKIRQGSAGGVIE